VRDWPSLLDQTLCEEALQKAGSMLGIVGPGPILPAAAQSRDHRLVINSGWRSEYISIASLDMPKS